MASGKRAAVFPVGAVAGIAGDTFGFVASVVLSSAAIGSFDFVYARGRTAGRPGNVS